MFNVDDSTSFESIKMDTGNFPKQMDRMITMNVLLHNIKKLMFWLFENIFGFITTGME